MSLFRNFGITGIANTVEFGKNGGTISYDFVSKTFNFGQSSAIIIPSGSSAQQPLTATLGMLRVNTDGTPYLEFYNNTSWTTIGAGSLNSITVVSQNGFTGTVVSTTSSAAITLATTVDGLIKGVSGTLVTASTATDYQVPLQLTTTGTGAATFDGRVLNIPISSSSTGTGSVTNVSVITANGFTGTVANSSTTPEITLQTTVDGLLKGSGGSLVAASTSTDYQVPLVVTTLGSGLASFDGKTLNIPPSAAGTGSGTVTNVSVASINGFSGTVAFSTTTPVISLETTVSGLLKGANGSLIQASTSTDYQVPLQLTTTGTGAATFNGSTLNIPTNTATLYDFSVTDANGFTATVLNSTTAPVVSIRTTTADGVLKSVSGALVQASTSTDYQVPLQLTTTGTGAATFDGRVLNIPIAGTGTGSGSVTTVSVVSANGFTGTVANASTTPAITLRTSVSGLLKGSGGALIAASTTTDYQVPLQLTTSGSGAATFDGSTLNIPVAEGTVKSVEIQAVNGFIGTVSNATTTASIALGTIVTGLIKGVAGGLAQASTATDYQVPITLTTNGTGAATFDGRNLNIPTGSASSGTVQTVSVVSANGFSGTVANSTTAPAITLQTTVSGLVKGVSGTLVAASTASDYQVPLSFSTTGTGIATFDGRNLNIPQGVTQLLPGTNVSIVSTGSTGTGIVTISVPSVSATSIVGGDTNQIPYQTAPSITGFSSKFTWNNTSNTLGVGDYGVVSIITAPNSISSFLAGSLTVKGGNASSQSPAGNITISGGSGLTSLWKGGNLTLQGGAGSTLGSGDVVIRTSASSTLVDRLRILQSGAWSVGINNTFTGNYGDVLTSQGPDAPPVWEAPGGGGGVQQILAGEGITIDPVVGTGVVTITATGSGGGGGVPGGLNGQLQYNDFGAFTGTSQILYNGTNQLNVGAVNSTFTIAAVNGTTTRGGNLLLKSGDQISGGTATRITISGGSSQANNVNGGSVYIDGGVTTGGGTSTGGSVYIRTTTSSGLVDRLVIDPDGAWTVSGNTGNNGQVLTSQGPGLPPIWMAGGGGGGGSGVTLVNVSGGTTGLTTFGGPITSTGTITITGTLAVRAGGTGLSALPGTTGTLFFNNANTFAAITGLKYDGATNLYFNSVRISTEDNFNEFTQTNPINIKPGTARITTAFAAAANFSGGDNSSPINRAGHAIIAGGVNTTPTRSGYVILRTNNFDRFTVNDYGAYGLPISGGVNYGTAGQVLTSQGTNAPPIWTDAGGGGGTGTVGVIAVTASLPLNSTGGNSPNISLGTVPVASGGTGFTNYLFGDMLYASGTTTFSILNAGSAGQILAIVNGRPQWTSTSGGVQSFSGGVTGLTPSTPTSGIVTLSGRLNLVSGGTGADNKDIAFNNLSPALFRGDTIYRDTNEHRRLPIGQEGYIMTVAGGIPAWTKLDPLPELTGNTYKFLTNNGTSPFWSNLITYSDNGLTGNDVNLTAEDAKGAGYAGGNVNITAGNPGFGTLATRGNVTIAMGNSSSASFAVLRRGNTQSFLTISSVGSMAINNDYGSTDQVLTSRGPSLAPIWKSPPSGLPSQLGKAGNYLTTDGANADWTPLPVTVSKIVAGNSNIVVSPESGTGIVTLSVVGEGFQGVTSFSAGTTGFSPSASTSGVITLSGTLLPGSGGTGISSYVAGDLLYSTGATSLAKLPIGANGRVLSSNGSAPVWTSLTGLPVQTTATIGYALTTDGANASWSSQFRTSGVSTYINALPGSTGFSGSPGGNIYLQSGNTGSGDNGGGGSIILQLGSDISDGYLSVKNPTTEFFRITRFGSWAFAGTTTIATLTGNAGQILTSNGPNMAPMWTNAGTAIPDQTGYSGYFLTTDGFTASWTTISGGTGLPSGASGTFQYNNGGAFAGTNEMYFGPPNTILLGNANTFTIKGTDSANVNLLPGASVLIKGGQSGATSLVGATAAAGSVTIQGGDGKSAPGEGSGGNVFINGGTAPTNAGYVSIGTGATTTERIRFLSTGPWLINNAIGTFGQAITSFGNGATPQWTNVVNRIVAGTNITISSTNIGGTGVVTINSAAAPLSTATTTTLGGVKVGSGLSITQDGILNAVGSITDIVATTGTTVVTSSTGIVTVGASTASTATIGSIKVGAGLAISEDGTLSTTGIITERFELAFAATGLVGNGTIFLYTAARNITIPANLQGTYNSALVSASVNTTMQIYKLSAAGVINNIGSILFAANAQSGTYTFPSEVTLTPGDTLYMTIGASDASLSDVSLTIYAAVY